MKKSYLLIAAAGLIMAACSQEDDFVAQNQTAAGQNDGAVMFDTYLSNTSTRAGKEETMTTSTLQQSGFGVIAFYHDNTTYTTGTSKPDFMWNQKVSYDAYNWSYSPLKYWPNETDNDNQTNPAEALGDRIDKVSFFAYAPYVDETTTKTTLLSENDGFEFKDKGDLGLQAITNNSDAQDPKVLYKVSTTVPSSSVDLLWGTSSGFNYHPVRDANNVITMTAGVPVLNMEKPALDEKIKFDFKHALARIGMTIVGAFDQIAQGGNKDAATKITVQSIKIRTDKLTQKNKYQNVFATQGILNLNNGSLANRAVWEKNGFDFNKTTSPYYSEIEITNEGQMNPNLKFQYNGLAAKAFPFVHGVLPTEQNVIVTSDPWNEKTITADTEYKESDGYFDSSKKPVEQTASNFKYGTLESGHLYAFKNGGTYTSIGTAAPTVDLTKNAVDIELDSKITAEPTDPDKIYIKLEASAYSQVSFTDAKANYSSKDIYTIKSETALKPLYAGTTYYTVKTTPGYFMVIPATDPATATTDAGDTPIWVTIKYYVTTKDDKLDGGTIEIENEITKKVTLKQFTNGKSYNLKLILGLTSVKVDAEVSNWEVGTVESNLPQNLE